MNAISAMEVPIKNLEVMRDNTRQLVDLKKQLNLIIGLLVSIVVVLLSVCYQKGLLIF